MRWTAIHFISELIQINLRSIFYTIWHRELQLTTQKIFMCFLAEIFLFDCARVHKFIHIYSKQKYMNIYKCILIQMYCTEHYNTISSVTIWGSKESSIIGKKYFCFFDTKAQSTGTNVSGFTKSSWDWSSGFLVFAKIYHILCL